MDIFLLSVLGTIGGGIFSFFSPFRLKNIVFCIITILSLSLSGIFSLHILTTNKPVSGDYHTVFAQYSHFGIDTLSAFFIFIVSFAGIPAILYTAGYMKKHLKTGPVSTHYLFTGIFFASLLMLFCTTDALLFLLFWELMSLSSFFLMTFEHEKPEVLKTSVYYIVAMHTGLLFLLFAFGYLTVHSGSADFSSFSEILTRTPATQFMLFLLFFAGFGTKAGFIPLHTWLPKAHPAAPSNISAIMSGIMIKCGIYGILRILLISGNHTAGIGIFMLSVSSLTALYAITLSLAETDMKRILAMSSIENIGIAGIGLSAGIIGVSAGNTAMTTLGFSGCLFHVLNHSIMKPLLFFGAGMVYQSRHERSLEKLGGVVHSDPAAAGLFLTGSAAISGLPPLCGFAGEFLIYLALIAGISGSTSIVSLISIIALAIMSLTGALTLVSFSRIFSIVFLGAGRTESHDSPAGPLMRIPALFLAVICVVSGVFPAVSAQIFAGSAALLSGNSFSSEILIQAISIITRCSAGFLLVLCAVYSLCRMGFKTRIRSSSTWGCGYQRPTSRMQYTSSSFSAIGLDLIKFFTKHDHRPQLHGLFPSETASRTASVDVIEHFAISPALKILRAALKRFWWIQSGNTRDYILYGLIFLIFVILWFMGAA